MWRFAVFYKAYFFIFADVDTPEPDEKSIITYVSQLYDVFPDPPSGHPLFDAEGQKKLASFKDLASSLHAWIRESIAIMQVRYQSPSYQTQRANNNLAQLNKKSVSFQKWNGNSADCRYSKVKKVYLKNLSNII